MSWGKSVSPIAEQALQALYGRFLGIRWRNKKAWPCFQPLLSVSLHGNPGKLLIPYESFFFSCKMILMLQIKKWDNIHKAWMNYLNHIVDFHFLPYTQGTTQLQWKETWGIGSEAQASFCSIGAEGTQRQGKWGSERRKMRKGKEGMYRMCAMALLLTSSTHMMVFLLPSYS